MLITGGWVVLGAGMEDTKISLPTNFDVRTVQPTASRYTDHAMFLILHIVRSYEINGHVLYCINCEGKSPDTNFNPIFQGKILVMVSMTRVILINSSFHPALSFVNCIYTCLFLLSLTGERLTTCLLFL